MNNIVDKYFGNIIAGLHATPGTILLGFALATGLVIAGIVLYINRTRIKGLRWPGITCAMLGCAGLVSNFVQYVIH